MVIQKQSVNIDNQLRLVLFGLECALNVEFAPNIVEQIFKDYGRDSSGEKRYALWAGAGLEVTGHVEHYEPEDIWLSVASNKSFTPSLSTIEERAKYQVYRLEQRQEAEISGVR